MTNMPELIKALDGLCRSTHTHAQMLDGQAKRTERYTPALVRTILKVVRRRLRVRRAPAWHGTLVPCIKSGGGAAARCGIGPWEFEKPADQPCHINLISRLGTLTHHFMHTRTN